MKVESLDRAFSRIGARLLLGSGGLDVGRDGGGEYFKLDRERALAGAYDALDPRPDSRHLVLTSAGEERREWFLCGHDERHWFVAGVRRPVATVAAAMEALLPRGAAESLRVAGARHGDRFRRHNRGFLRQGEWFFVPAPGFVPARVTLRDEPLRRGGGKAHVVEEVVRTGGEPVYVSRTFVNGLTEAERKELQQREPELCARQQWRLMTRDASVFARGRVRHPDHATLRLPGWHRVLMADDVASKQLAFLD